MDDDYDNYVPQISTMDWQNLGRETEDSQVRVAPTIGPSGSGSFLYDVGQPPIGTSQLYRSFPGMEIMPEQPFVGVAGYGSGQGFHPNDFVSDCVRSQMTVQQQLRRPIRPFNPVNASYITEDTARQNVFQHGMISANSNPITKSTKSTKVPKKNKKTALVDSNLHSQKLGGIHSAKPMQTHQTHNTQQYDDTNAELAYYKNNIGPGLPVSYPTLSHAVTQITPHPSAVASSSSELCSLRKNYSMQPDELGYQHQFTNVQKHTISGSTEQPRLQNYPFKHLQSHYGQTVVSGQQEQYPMLVQPQQKASSSGSHQHYEGDDYITKQYMHAGNHQLVHKEAVTPIVGYPNAYQAGYSNMQKQGPCVVDRSTGHGHHQFYLSNQYNNITRQQQQHQHVYRELYECDQQLAALLPQVQQNPELETYVEKFQLRRQYLHAQLMQINYTMNTAAAANTADTNMSSGPVQSKELQQSSTSHIASLPQFPGQYPTHFSQQKLVHPNLHSYSNQQNFIQHHVSAQQLHPTPPIPPAPLHSNALGTNLSKQPMSPHPHSMTQQHQPMVSLQQYMPPLSNMSSPSVAVMSTSNVQVNIRPELPGRTLISVYHGQDVQPNVTKAIGNSVSMHYDPATADMQQILNYESQQHYCLSNRNDQQQDLSAKDSIPPEPLPPYLSREHRLRQQQQKLKQQEQFNENVQNKFSTEAESRLPSPPSPMCITNVSLCFFSCDETTANFSKTLPIFLNEVVEATYETSKLVLNPQPQVETELIKTDAQTNDCEMLMFQVREENQAHSSNQEYQKFDEHAFDKKANDGEITEENQLQLQPGLAKDSPTGDGNISDGCENFSFSTIINKQEPKQETKIRYDNSLDFDVMENKNSKEDSKEILEAETTIEKEREKLDQIKSFTENQLEETHKKNEESRAAAFPCKLDDALTHEITTLDNDDFPFTFQTTSTDTHTTFAETRKGRKTTKSRGKKRKIDWNKDDDYIGTRERKPRLNKRETEKRKSVSSVTADETFQEELGIDSEFLVEKRSSRKRLIGRKAQYGDESEDEDEIGTLLNEHKEFTENRIVERILGIRFIKRTSDTRMNEENIDETKKSDEFMCKVSEDKLFSVESDSTIDLSKKNISIDDSTDTKSSEKDTNTGKLLILDDKNEDIDITSSSVKEISHLQISKMSSDEIVEEIYVKFKGFSYMHCEWKTIHELEALGDKRITAKLNRWKQKFQNDSSAENVQEDDEVFFNEDYTIVSRVLDETYDKKERQQYVFVKWKSLPYEESTWELEQDVPKHKLLDFRRRSEFDLFKLKEQPKISPKEFSSRLAISKDKVYNNDNVLREYQHEGINWLLWTWISGRNCILADEMGLGKTIQSIVFLLSLYDIGVHGPFLIVVPLSTLGNWEREFAEWAPEINAIVYHGGAVSRKIIRDFEFFYKKVDGRRRNVPKFDALITTYEVVVQEVEVLRRINFSVCVIDEAHRIKNRNCKLLQSGLLSLRMNHRVLLTGTPLQNNIQELFSLLNFLEPEQFANSEAFLQQFGQCQTEEQVQKLQEILKPMMLRRLKEDVEKELQPKEETIIEVQLSNIQKKYYRAVLERNFTHLMKGTTPSLMNTMMQLRKCCCHPYLINGAEEQILNELKHQYPEKSEEERQVFGLISSSGKVVLIDKLLPKLRADGHRILIFSQMVKVLDLLEEYLNIKGYPFERIDGNIRGNERQAAIDRFSKPENKDCFIFLLCTRAGGLGINLTAADTVIIFDSDWNPQNDLQAQARCHRIGQTKQVKIYRLITANTYEREMFDKASLKLGLDKAVLQSMRTECNLQNSHQLSRQEVEDLLRKGAYGAIMDEDNEGAKFGEEDIETILERRAQTIRLEPGIKGSTFAKASFTVSHNRDDIDVSDPDFWSKWARKANIDVGVPHDDYSTKHLIIHEPRARKKRFEEETESADDGISDDGTSRIAENVKSRSVRKKRRAAGIASAVGTENNYNSFIGNTQPQDELSSHHKVPACSQHPELSCTITQLKKVEKLLIQYGWGRWSTFKKFSELNEHELEHISRTLILHCVREFRGDEKTQEFIWNLITPSECSSKIVEKSEGSETNENDNKISDVDSKSKFYQGWAQKPEYNPPCICVDMTFQRHLHRNASKLINRIKALETNNFIAKTKESSIEKQADIDKQTNSVIHSSECSTACKNEKPSIGHKKEQISIKKTLENSDLVTRAKELLLTKQSNIGKKSITTTHSSTTHSAITNSERSTSISNKTLFGQNDNKMSNSEYLLQLLTIMGYGTDDSSGMNSLMKSFITSSPTSTNIATLNQQIQTLLALTSLSSATDINNGTNSALTSALATLYGSASSSVNTGANPAIRGLDGYISRKSDDSKKLENNDAITRANEFLPKQSSFRKQSFTATPPTSKNSSERSTSVANKASSIGSSDYTKLMSNPQYMLQLLAMMGYSTESSSSIGLNSLMNSLIASPSSSSSSTYSAALQNQQLQTLLALTSLSGTTDMNNTVNSSYLSAALASFLGTTSSSVNSGDIFSRSPICGLDSSICGKFDNLKKMENRTKVNLPAKQNISTTQSATHPFKGFEGSASVSNKASLSGQNELTKMMSNPQYMLQLLAMMGYSTESSSSIGMNSLMNSLIASSSSSSSTYSASLQNQQLQTMLALASLSGTTDLNNTLNSSYLSAALASFLGSNSVSSNNEQKKQETQNKSQIGQRKIHKTSDESNTHNPK